MAKYREMTRVIEKLRRGNAALTGYGGHARKQVNGWDVLLRGELKQPILRLSQVDRIT